MITATWNHFKVWFSFNKTFELYLHSPYLTQSWKGPCLRQHAVSVFDDIFFESDKYWIRTNPNNNLMMRRAGLSTFNPHYWWHYVVGELWNQRKQLQDKRHKWHKLRSGFKSASHEEKKTVKFWTSRESVENQHKTVVFGQTNLLAR